MTGSDLRERRIALGLAQDQLGISASHARRIENGNADRMLKGAEKIVDAYGLEIRQKTTQLKFVPYKRLVPFTTDDLKAWDKIDKIIRKATTNTWLYEEQEKKQ